MNSRIIFLKAKNFNFNPKIVFSFKRPLTLFNKIAPKAHPLEHFKNNFTHTTRTSTRSHAIF